MEDFKVLQIIALYTDLHPEEQINLPVVCLHSELPGSPHCDQTTSLLFFRIKASGGTRVQKSPVIPRGSTALRWTETMKTKTEARFMFVVMEVQREG